MQNRLSELLQRVDVTMASEGYSDTWYWYYSKEQDHALEEHAEYVWGVLMSRFLEQMNAYLDARKEDE